MKYFLIFNIEGIWDIIYLIKMLNEIITGLEKVKEKHKKANINISNILNKLQNNLIECENKLKEIPENENQEKINVK